MTTNINTEEPTKQTYGKMGHNSGSADRPAVEMVKLALAQLIVWDPAAEQADDIDLVTIEGEAEILKDAGQRTPAVARRREDGTIEVVAKAYYVRAVALHNESHPNAPIELDLRVFNTMSDEFAYRALFQDVEQGPAPSSLARGLFYERAVKQFGSEANAAKGLCVAKSTISKNLDTTRCLAFIAAKTLVHRDISQRDAMWLMQIVGRKKDGSDAPDAERRKLVINAIGSMTIMPAKKLFGALRAALRSCEPEKARAGVFPIRSGGREIGTMRRSRKDGPITFSIADAGDIELDQVVEAFREALAQMRR